jgi:hypothetical protein
MLTSKEIKLIEDCGKIFNRFCKLEVYHQSDQKDVADAIHTIQHIIMKRDAYRNHPEIFQK